MQAARSKTAVNLINIHVLASRPHLTGGEIAAVNFFYTFVDVWV